jgi:hypothetical protein
MNTVEQGESSFEFVDGKFIFSDRINVMADGGPVDPPTKADTVEAGRSFMKDWFSSPTTLARYSMNTAQGFSKSIPDIQDALGRIDKTTYNLDVPNENKAQGAFHQQGKIDFYKDPDAENTVHEFTHASQLDDTMSRVIKDKWGTPAKAIQDKTGLPFREAIQQEFGIKGGNYFGETETDNAVNHSRYMSKDGELYPRIMEMRSVLKAKPGQEIKDEDIKFLRENMKNKDMFNFYSDEQIKEMLNTLAANKSKRNYDNLV